MEVLGGGIFWIKKVKMNQFCWEFEIDDTLKQVIEEELTSCLKTKYTDVIHWDLMFWEQKIGLFKDLWTKTFWDSKRYWVLRKGNEDGRNPVFKSSRIEEIFQHGTRFLQEDGGLNFSIKSTMQFGPSFWHQKSFLEHRQWNDMVLGIRVSTDWSNFFESSHSSLIL